MTSGAELPRRMTGQLLAPGMVKASARDRGGMQKAADSRPKHNMIASQTKRLRVISLKTSGAPFSVMLKTWRMCAMARMRNVVDTAR